MAAAEQAEALKQQQQVAAQRQAAEAAEQEKKEDLARLLTIQPTDSPEVRVQVHRAKRRQQGLAFDEQRVQVAENNLMPRALSLTHSFDKQRAQVAESNLMPLENNVTLGA